MTSTTIDTDAFDADRLDTDALEPDAFDAGPDAGAAAVLGTGSLFRFATAGSVDDGKSTLVGRLLHDAKAILADTLDGIARTSADRGFGGTVDGGPVRLDLALLTDGLRAEREQGITIDVAYRYFATDRRTFVLADCPGHVQYTRNTVTGASTADAVVLLVDARKGVLEQTRRHLSVAGLLRVPHVLVAVNKIDLVDYAEDVFDAIAAGVREDADAAGVTSLTVIPVSALEGDNVVDRSARTPWYAGPTLLEALQTLPDRATTERSERATPVLRFPVQLVLRPQGALAPGLDPAQWRDYRAYAGQVAEGTVRVGDPVTVLSPGRPPRESVIAGIDAAGAAVDTASAPRSVALRLADELDVTRGDTIVAAGTEPELTAEAAGRVCWLGEAPLRPGARVLVKHGTATTRAVVAGIDGVLDLDTLAQVGADRLELNDIGQVRLRLASPLPLEPYAQHRSTGAFLLIDPQSGNTLAAGMVSGPDPAPPHTDPEDDAWP